MTHRLSTLLLASASVAALSLAWVPSPALAEKVGVTSAVNPDAYSDGAPVKIGASVFYNQRINTDGSGLVQVLLVDGSTFTVGPGSDLVIDKFVYDPKKNKGEVVATFVAAWPTSATICSPSSTATSWSTERNIAGWSAVPLRSALPSR
jgi:hypothetical protein